MLMQPRLKNVFTVFLATVATKRVTGLTISALRSGNKAVPLATLATTVAMDKCL